MLGRKLVIIIGICCILCSQSIFAAHSQKDKTSSNVTIEFKLPADEPKDSKKVKIIKYNKELYDLAYKIFLGNNDTKDAYTVAASAVQQGPDNIEWRNRFAQVAIWYQQAYVGLQQYIYLVHHTDDKSALGLGIKLATMMHEDYSLSDLLAYEIQKGNNQETIWQDYIASMTRLGETEKVIANLNANQQHLSPEFYYLHLAQMYRITSDLEHQFNALVEYSAIAGITPPVAQQEAQIYLTKGNVKSAYGKMHAASKKAKNNDSAFWREYAQLAYLLNNHKEALRAYGKLLHYEKKPEEDVYLRLIDLNLRRNPFLAYQYAKKGKKAHPDSYSLANYTFALAIETNHWREIPKLIARTSKSIRQQLDYDPMFWSTKAQYWLKLKNQNMALLTFSKGIKHLPDSTPLKADYLSTLIQIGDLTRLRQALPLWQNQVPSSPDLWGPYTVGYARLYDRNMALLTLNLFYQQNQNYWRDPYYMIMMKDVLDDAFYPIQSRQMSQYAWGLYLNLLARQSDPYDYDQIIDYVKLSSREAPGDPTASALSLLQNLPMTSDAEELMIAWALDQSNYPLAEAIYRAYQMQGFDPPSWAVLSIALHHVDRYKIKQVLTQNGGGETAYNKSTEVISYRDRVLAADMIDAVPLAQSLAYDGLKGHPHDSEMYDDFTQEMLKTADSIEPAYEYYQYGSAEGPRERIALTYFITPGISMTPYASLWNFHNLDPGANPALPQQDERMGIKNKITQHRGELDIDVGYRHELNSFATGKISRSYLISQNFNSKLSFGYHQEADDTLGLLLGGMKNNIVLNLDYDLTPEDTLIGEYDQNWFYTQDQFHVAYGEQETIRLQHKFKHTYPDWTLSAYGTTAQYQGIAGTLPGSIQTIFPPSSPATGGTLIPGDFSEIGGIAEFGENYLEDYTHAWRPFASVTMNKNSLVGFGRIYDAGIAGTVIGKDHLALYYQQGENTGVGINKERLIIIDYRLYF